MPEQLDRFKRLVQGLIIADIPLRCQILRAC